MKPHLVSFYLFLCLFGGNFAFPQGVSIDFEKMAFCTKLTSMCAKI